MASKLCFICSEHPPKYKCPQCRIAYCSLTCYKVHKEQPCGTSVNEKITEKDVENKNEVEKGIKENDKVKKIEEKIEEKKKENEKIIEKKSPIKNDQELNETYQLEKKQLDLLMGSQEIKDQLKSKRLRETLLSIDSSNKREKLLQEYLEVPEFVDFVDLLCKTVEYDT